LKIRVVSGFVPKSYFRINAKVKMKDQDEVKLTSAEAQYLNRRISELDDSIGERFAILNMALKSAKAEKEKEVEAFKVFCYRLNEQTDEMHKILIERLSQLEERVLKLERGF
jgi:hypothetical protein